MPKYFATPHVGGGGRKSPQNTIFRHFRLMFRENTRTRFFNHDIWIRRPQIRKLQQFLEMGHVHYTMQQKNTIV